MFWAKGPISQLEYLCMKSFVDKNYELLVWSYDPDLKLPLNVILCDANDVIDESKLFLNQRGVYAGFSDFFRYKVLNGFGGLYADTDVIAVRPADELPKHQFLVTEYTKGDVYKLSHSQSNKKLFENLPLGLDIKINGNVIYNPTPQRGNVIDLALAYARRFPKTHIKWCEIGPDLLSAIVDIYPLHNFEIQPPVFANPIPPWECPQRLLQDEPGGLDPKCFFIHCYNERWRVTKVDKNAAVRQRGTLLSKILH